MGTSRSAAEFSRKITNLATVTARTQRIAVEAGALTAKEIMVAEAGLSSSSRVAGAKVSVGYDVRGFSNPTALVRWRGPFHLVDNPTRPHTIPKSRRGRAKRLKLPDGGVRASVQHPGTSGKRSFPRAAAKAKIAVPRVMARPLVSGWRQALR